MKTGFSRTLDDSRWKNSIRKNACVMMEWESSDICRYFGTKEKSADPLPRKEINTMKKKGHVESSFAGNSLKGGLIALRGSWIYSRVVVRVNFYGVWGNFPPDGRTINY